MRGRNVVLNFMGKKISVKEKNFFVTGRTFCFNLIPNDLQINHTMDNLSIQLQYRMPMVPRNQEPKIDPKFVNLDKITMSPSYIS